MGSTCGEIFAIIFTLLILISAGDVLFYVTFILPLAMRINELCLNSGSFFLLLANKMENDGGIILCKLNSLQLGSEKYIARAHINLLRKYCSAILGVTKIRFFIILEHAGITEGLKGNSSPLPFYFQPPGGVPNVNCLRSFST